MKIVNRFLMMLMALPFVFMSCGGDFSKELKEEMQKMKSECPQYQGDGVTISDVNFYEDEKILEYICSIEGVEEIDDNTVAIMKEAIVEALSSDVSMVEEISLKLILKKGYRIHYIYTDVYGNNLCEIEITKDDLQ